MKTLFKGGHQAAAVPLEAAGSAPSAPRSAPCPRAEAGGHHGGGAGGQRPAAGAPGKPRPANRPPGLAGRAGARCCRWLAPPNGQHPRPNAQKELQLSIPGGPRSVSPGRRGVRRQRPGVGRQRRRVRPGQRRGWRGHWEGPAGRAGWLSENSGTFDIPPAAVGANCLSHYPFTSVTDAPGSTHCPV